MSVSQFLKLNKSSNEIKNEEMAKFYKKLSFKTAAKNKHIKDELILQFV